MAGLFLERNGHDCDGTALPTIATALDEPRRLHMGISRSSSCETEESTRIVLRLASAYTLSSTAFIPLSGSLANAFGRQVFHQHSLPCLLILSPHRRPIMLLCIAFFAVGSALAGAAQSMPMMIAARVIGGGGIISLSEIIAADIVPLAERGIYNGPEWVGLVFRIV
ncbi:hypothetical protein FB451DRAFT_1201828 [Mycena latifolia]|nr:hypothetical protein FB451DRAFT_1201828 [Mycena latifolia]